MAATDIIGIKANNVKNVVRTVRFEDFITKREIADKTGLSFATVSNLCNELTEKGFLLKSKNDILSVGRTPQNLTFNYKRNCVIAINIQLRGKLSIAILNFRNQIVARKVYYIDPLLKAEDIIDIAYKYFNLELAPQMDSGTEYIGVGVAVSSIYDTSTSKLICCAIPQLENADMKIIAEKRFGLPAYVDNEANLCAYALRVPEINAENVIYIHASEGLGLGVIVRGKLLQGKNGYAAEIAHMPIGRYDRRCKLCGGYGCIENELCVNGLLTNYLGQEPTDKFSEWDKFSAALESGEGKALRTAENAGTYLGKLVSVLVDIFDPESVYIGGEIASVHSYMESYVLSVMKEKCGLWHREIPKLVWDNDSNMRINTGISEKVCVDWSPV